MIYLISFIMGGFFYAISSFSTLPFLNDFYSYYIAGNLIQHNLPIYGVTEAFKIIVEQNNFQFTWGTGYSYPPLLALIMIPISSLPFSNAAVFWASLQILLYGLFIKHIILKTHLKKNAYILPLLFFFGPALGSVVNGQINIVILWCLYFYFYSKSELLRAIGLCVAGWIKVFPFLLLVKDVLQKKRRFILIAIPLFMILLLFQSIPRSGLYIMEYFTQILPRLQTSFDPYITNQSLVGVISRFQGEAYDGLIAKVVEGVTFLGIVIITIRKGNKFPREIDLLWLLTILLVAGKNSYWNFTPAIFIYLYLFEKHNQLDKKSRFVLIVSAAVNILFPYVLFGFMCNPQLLLTLGGKIASSIGFYSLVLLYYPLLKRVGKIM